MLQAEITKKNLKHQDLGYIPKQNPQNQPTQLIIKSPIEVKDDKLKIMKKTLLLMVAAAMLFSCTEKRGGIVKLHEGYYAFCGASGAVATGDTIIVQGEKFAEGCAICPVLPDTSISNLAMYGVSPSWGKVMGTEGQFDVRKNFQYPGNDGSTRWDGKLVWSLYHYFDTSTYIPQFNPATLSWEMMKPGNLSLIHI